MLKYNLVIVATLSFIFNSCSEYKANLSPDSQVFDADDNVEVEVEVENTTLEPLTFQTIRTKILEPHCINCHTGKHQNYESYAVVKLASEAIFQRITTKNLLRRMPSGRDPLSVDLINLFQDWTNAGAPEFEMNPDVNPSPISESESQMIFQSIKLFNLDL